MEDMNEDILKTIRGSSPDARPTDAVLSDINNAVVEKRQRDECFVVNVLDFHELRFRLEEDQKSIDAYFNKVGNEVRDGTLLHTFINETISVVKGWAECIINGNGGSCIGFLLRFSFGLGHSPVNC